MGIMRHEKLSLEINTDLARRTIVNFIRSEVQRAGFQRALVGLSGGVDSSLTGYLTAEGIGPENVLALRMPYKTSSPDSMEHAALVIEATGMKHLDVPITEMVDPLFKRFPEAGRVRQGNIMARARMIVLYDQSAAFGGLVVGTGNKSEILLGYTTLYGDAACAIAPLGDLYKTQVRALAEAVGVPKVILEKPPSADLWVGQTDEGELGFSYVLVDQLLLYLVEERHTPEECVDAGFDPDFVTSVMEQVRRNQFKRMMPPIAKLSNRTVGYDFLYPRDWGT
jgi:NAD+ synthase